MKNQIQLVLNMLKSLSELRKANEALINSNLMVKQLFDDLENDYTNLKKLVEKADLHLQPFTEEKAEVRGTYIDDMFTVMTILRELGIKVNNKILFDLTNYSISALRNMPNALLIERSTKLVDYLNQHEALVTEAGLTTEQLANMTTGRDNFEKLFTTPIDERANRKQATAELNEYAAEVSEKIYKRGVRLIKGVYKKESPGFCMKFETIVHKKGKVVKHHDVIGRIIDADTKEAVPFATLKVPLLNIDRDLRGVGGIFYLDDVEQGTYVAICTQPDYHPVEVTFRKVAETVKRITIEMKFNPIAHAENRADPSKMKRTKRQKPTSATNADNTLANKQTTELETKTTEPKAKTDKPEAKTKTEPVAQTEPKTASEKTSKTKAKKPKKPKAEATDA